MRSDTGNANAGETYGELYGRLCDGARGQKGVVGFYYKNLVTGEEMKFHDGYLFLAASVIKLPVFMAIEKMAAEGRARLSEEIKVTEAEKLPICGALTLFTGEPQVDVMTLCRLMISLSDNTATNVLIKRFGMGTLNDEFKAMGLKKMCLDRLLFDSEAAARGFENRMCLKDTAMLLERLYRGEFVSREVSDEIIGVMLEQQINHKIPGRFGDDDVPVAHKTGEDDGISNDVGIVYAKQPFILEFAGYDTCVGDWEDFIRRSSKALLDYSERR